MDEMEKYEKPTLELIRLARDVVMTSCDLAPCDHCPEAVCDSSYCGKDNVY